MDKSGYGERVARLSCFLVVDPMGVKKITKRKPELQNGQVAVRVKIIMPLEAFDCQFLGEGNIVIPVIDADITQ